MGDVARDHAFVDRNVIEAVDRVLVASLGGDERLAAPEAADDKAIALRQPANLFLVRHHRPGLAELAIHWSRSAPTSIGRASSTCARAM